MPLVWKKLDEREGNEDEDAGLSGAEGNEDAGGETGDDVLLPIISAGVWSVTTGEGTRRDGDRWGGRVPLLDADPGSLLLSRGGIVLARRLAKSCEWSAESWCNPRTVELLVLGSNPKSESCSMWGGLCAGVESMIVIDDGQESNSAISQLHFISVLKSGRY
jgi:hypothetical protein